MSNLADGYACVIEAALRGARPDPELAIDKWAEEFMVVPRDSAKPGRYRIAHTPMARRIMQVLGPRHPSRRVVVRGASQMLKTQVALNFLAASAHRAPANMLVLEPTDSLAKRLSARVTKVIRDVPVLQSVFAKPRSRDSRNTVFAKDFEGGTMYIATAGSAANLAEIQAIVQPDLLVAAPLAPVHALPQSFTQPAVDVGAATTPAQTDATSLPATINGRHVRHKGLSR